MGFLERQDVFKILVLRPLSFSPLRTSDSLLDFIPVFIKKFSETKLTLDFLSN